MNTKVNPLENENPGLFYVDLLKLSTMTLATTDLEGNPHATPVYFASSDRGHLLKIYFFSDERSLHGRHLAKNPKAAAAIFPDCNNWQDIKGLQMHGVVNMIETNLEWDFAWQRYQIKFPFVRSMAAEVAQNQFYVYTPSWIRLVDNSKGFGYRKEWNQNDNMG